MSRSRLPPGAYARLRRRDPARPRGGHVPERDRPSPFLDDDARRDLGGRLERVDSVARDRYLFYTACTPPPGGSCSRAKLPRTTACRAAEPVLEDVRALFDDGESRARRSGGRCPASRGCSSRHRPTASGCVRSPGSPSTTARAPRHSRPRTAGLAGSTGRSRPSNDPPGSASPGVLELARRRTTSPRPSSSASPTARPRGSSSASSTEADRRRAGPDAARTGDAHGAPRVLRDAAEGGRRRSRDAGEPRVGARSRAPLFDAALESGVKLDLTDLQGAELRQTLLADLEGPSATSPCPAWPSTAATGGRLWLGPRSSGLQRGLSLGRASRSPARSTGSTSTPSARGGWSRTTSPASARRPRGTSTASSAADPALRPRAARPRRRRAARRRLPALAGRRVTAACFARPRARTCRLRQGRLPGRRRLLAQVDTARERRASTRSGSAPETCATTRRVTAAPRGVTSGKCRVPRS